MLGFAGAALSFLGSLFSALKAILGFVERKENIEQGQDRQRAADEDATLKAAEDARSIEGRNDALSDDALRERLRREP